MNIELEDARYNVAVGFTLFPINPSPLEPLSPTQPKVNPPPTHTNKQLHERPMLLSAVGESFWPKIPGSYFSLKNHSPASHERVAFRPVTPAPACPFLDRRSMKQVRFSRPTTKPFSQDFGE